MSSGDHSCDAIVIGVGVIGASVACELARRGWRVIGVDRNPGAGQGSTSASSAIVRFTYSTRAGVAMAYEGLQYWLRWPQHVGQCGVVVTGKHTGFDIDMGMFSRRRGLHGSSMSVLG